MAKKKKPRSTKLKSRPTKEKTSIQELFKKLVENNYLSWIIALIYFLVLLILSLLYHKVGDYGVETDFFWGYVPDAKSFINDELNIDAFRGPLYPVTLALVNIIVSDYFYSGVLIGIISASLVLALSFNLLKKLFTPPVAFFVILIVAVNPVFVQYTYSAGTDMFFNLLVVATLYFFFKDEKLNYKSLIVAALIGGLSYLTRYNGVFLLSFIIVILFINYWQIDWLKRIKATALFLVVFGITILPWGLYCLNKKGNFFYNDNYKNIAYELFGKGNVSWDQFWFKESSSFTSLFDVIGRDVGLFASTIIGNIGEHFILDMEKLIGWIPGVFVILGLIVLIFSNPIKNFKSRETGYYLSNLFFFALLLLVFYSERFSLFLIPFYMVIAIIPFFIERLKLYKIVPKQIGYLVAIVIFVVTISNSISFNSKQISSGPNELLELREWYMANVPERDRGKKIAARKAHVAYYLDMQFSLIPMAQTYPELIEKLKENKVDYLYFSTMEAAMRRQFQTLLNPEQNHPGLKPAVYFKNPPAVLYKVLE